MMADQKKKNKKQIKKMPPFTRPIVRKWIQVNLGYGVPPSEAAEKFLKRFADYNSEVYGDYHTRCGIVTKRFYDYNTNPKTKNYHEIKKYRALGNEDSEQISLLANPVEQIVFLETYLLSNDDLTATEIRGILSDIQKLVDKLWDDVRSTPPSHSTYGGATAELSSPDAIWNNSKKEV